MRRARLGLSVAAIGAALAFAAPAGTAIAKTSPKAAPSAGRTCQLIDITIDLGVGTPLHICI